MEVEQFFTMAKKDVEIKNQSIKVLTEFNKLKIGDQLAIANKTLRNDCVKDKVIETCGKSMFELSKIAIKERREHKVTKQKLEAAEGQIIIAKDLMKIDHEMQNKFYEATKYNNIKTISSPIREGDSDDEALMLLKDIVYKNFKQK